MATWHQTKVGPISPGHFSWYLVTDPAGQMRSVMAFDSEAEAEGRLAAWRARGVDVRHSYILRAKRDESGFVIR